MKYRLAGVVASACRVSVLRVRPARDRDVLGRSADASLQPAPFPFGQKRLRSMKDFLFLRTGLKTDRSEARLDVGKHRSSPSELCCCFHGRRTREFTSRCPKDTSDLRHKARYRCLNSVRFCKCTRCDRLPQKDNCGCISSSLGYRLLSVEIVKMLRSDSSDRDATPHLTSAGLSRSVSPIRRDRSARARSASPVHHGSEGLICARVFRALRRIAKAHEFFRKARISIGEEPVATVSHCGAVSGCAERRRCRE